MTPAEAVRAVCTDIEERHSGHPLIVAIDGGGGAGKSTLARGIGEALAGQVSIVRCDDFYRPLTGARYSQLTPAEAYENYFDWHRLRDEVLLPLRRGDRALYQRHDWSTDSLAELIEIEPREIVIVEGVFSTRPELRPLIDIAIFVQTPRDERIRRMTARGQPSTSWMDQWLLAEDWYFEKAAPHRQADLLIPGM